MRSGNSRIWCSGFDDFAIQSLDLIQQLRKSPDDLLESLESFEVLVPGDVRFQHGTRH